jgi:Glycosyltransferase family 87
LRTKLSFALLVVTFLWITIEASELTNLAWIHVVSENQGALPRFSLMALIWAIMVVAVLIPGKRFAKCHKPLCLLGLGALSLYLLEISFRSHNVDEVMHMITAWEIGQGKSPYRDFFHMYHPLLEGLWSPVMVWFKDDLNVLYAVKIFMLANLIPLTWVLNKLTQKAGGRLVYTLVALICVKPFAFTITEFRPDPFAALGSLLALWALTCQRPIWAGLFLGIGFGFHQKAALWGTLLLLCYLATRPTLQQAARFIGTTTLVSLAVPFWALASGFFRNYFQCAFQYTFQYASHQSATNLETSSSALLGSQIIHQSLPFFLTAIGGCYLLLRQNDKPGLLVALYGPCLAVTVISMKFLYPQYVIVFIPALAILASAGLRKLENFQGEGFEPKIPCIVVLAGAFLTLANWAAIPPIGNIRDAHQQTLDRIRPGQTYWGSGIIGLSHHPIFRGTPSYYIYAKDFAGRYFQRTGIQPYHHPPELISENSDPPTVIVGSVDSTRDCLAQMKARGFRYSGSDPNYLILDPKTKDE